MNPKNKQTRGPRPTFSGKSPTKGSEYYWHHRRYCPPWWNYDYDYDYYDNWYDYDWYDYDYSYSPRKSRGNHPSANMNESYDEYLQMAFQHGYQMGYKDGWQSAIDMMSSEKNEPSTPTENPEPDPMTRPGE